MTVPGKVGSRRLENAKEKGRLSGVEGEWRKIVMKTLKVVRLGSGLGSTTGSVSVAVRQPQWPMGGKRKGEG